MKPEKATAIEIRQLKKSYDDFTLDIPALSVRQGEIVGLVGENGAGKSTLIQSILNIITPHSGEIFLNGMDHHAQNVQSGIGVVFEHCSFSDVLCAADVNRILKAIFPDAWQERFFLDTIQEYSLPLHKAISQFSMGMKAKLSIIAALAHSPRIIFLDEATNNLDPVARMEINNLICAQVRKLGCTVFISSHLVNEVEQICDRILLMAHGKICLELRRNELKAHYSVTEQPSGLEVPPGAVAVLENGTQRAYLVYHADRLSNQSDNPITVERVMYFVERGKMLGEWLNTA